MKNIKKIKQIEELEIMLKTLQTSRFFPFNFTYLNVLYNKSTIEFERSIPIVKIISIPDYNTKSYEVSYSDKPISKIVDYMNLNLSDEA